MTDTEKEILNVFKSIRRLTIEGNREYWSELYFSGGKFYKQGGSTLPHTTDYKNKITKDEALRTIKEYLWSEAGNWKLKDEQLLEMLNSLNL